MLPPIPTLQDYGISPNYGFLPMELPLEILPDLYYNRWEAVAGNLQALILSRRLREVVERLPVLSTAHLQHPAEWRRAYSILAFMAHAYIWGGDKPAERVPPPISIPFLKICAYLELPPVATYAGVVLWNFRPIFADEPIDTLENLSTIMTFTGSLDESWFYLVSVAIEARAAPLLPLMLNAIAAARINDSRTVIECLRTFAETIDELGTLLIRMYENCDPHVFFHRIRPFLAGGRDMAEAGLPNGVMFDTGSGNDPYQQYGGGSNAQSTLIQFFDTVLGVEHRPTGESRIHNASKDQEGLAPSPRQVFIHEMRSYMPGPHRRFLEHTISIANIREYVESHTSNRALIIAYQACLAMLSSLRSKHINMVSRYIVVQAGRPRSQSQTLNSPDAPKMQNLATASQKTAQDSRTGNKKLKGTGGTALIPFLKQARDETGEPAIDTWAKRILNNRPVDGGANFAALGKMREHANGHMEIVGLAGTWAMDEDTGGICHW